MITDPKETVEFSLSDIVAYCHLFIGRPRSYCGVPRAEQSRHHGWGPNSIAHVPNFCPICGLKPCGKCILLYGPSLSDE